jgi:hypothetical protein
MKKILTFISTLVTMLFVSGIGMMYMASTASAQEVSIAQNMQDTSLVESSGNGALEASKQSDSALQNRSDSTTWERTPIRINIPDKISVDSILLALRTYNTIEADSLSTSAEVPTETLDSIVSDKRYKNHMAKWAGRDRFGRFTDQCAAHANGRLKRAGYYSQGHAYQIPYYFPSVINGYTKLTVPDISKLSSWNEKALAVLDMHRQAADYIKEHLDISKLTPGAYYVVNMYYTTSPYMLQFFYEARKQGTGNYGTHVGVLYYDAEYETWIVEHNIHGHVHYDALESILGGLSNPHKYGVTSISRVSR